MATGTVRAEKVPKPPEGKEAPPVNKTAEVYWGSKWYAAQILEEKDGKFHIHYNGESDSSNEWVPKDRVRFPSKPKGETKCEVEWGGKWYPAHVIAEGGDGQWKIKYDNDSGSWNEWVGKDRIRFPGKAKAAAQKDTPAKAAKQTKAEVLWNGTWYPAQALEEKDGKFRIQYDGYGDNWNEWVGMDRIRLLNQEKPAAKPSRGKKDQDEKQPNGQN